MVRLVNAQNATQTLPITTAVNVPFPSHKKKTNKQTKQNKAKQTEVHLGTNSKFPTLQRVELFKRQTNKTNVFT